MNVKGIIAILIWEATWMLYASAFLFIRQRWAYHDFGYFFARYSTMLLLSTLWSGIREIYFSTPFTTSVLSFCSWPIGHKSFLYHWEYNRKEVTHEYAVSNGLKIVVHYLKRIHKKSSFFMHKWIVLWVDKCF